MPPPAPCGEPCPCGSGRDFDDCCLDQRRAANRLTEEKLAAWARERGVEPHLELMVVELADGLPADLQPAPRWLKANITLGELLVAGDFMVMLAPPILRRFRAVAWGNLIREARSVRLAVAAEATRPPPPTDPTLARLAARLEELRALVRPTASPRDPGHLPPRLLQLSPAQRRLVYLETCKLRSGDETSSGVVEPGVVLELARALDRPLPPPRCRCGASEPCRHLLTVLDLALAELANPARPAAWTALARALDLPNWSRALTALEDVQAIRRKRAGAAPTVQVSFRLERDVRGRVTVLPFRHRRQRGGKFGPGRHATPRDFAGASGRYSPEDLAALKGLGYAGRYGGYAYGNGRGRLLEQAGELLALAGHPRVFLAGEEEPLAVKAAPVGLAVRPLGGGGVELAPTVDGAPVAAEALAGALRSMGSDGTFDWLDRDRRQWSVVTVEEPEAVKGMVAALAEHGQEFPAEAESALLERLGQLRELLPVDLPAELEGSELPPALVLVVRLGLQPVGLELAVLARPLAGAPAQAPGEGPPRLVASRAGGRQFTIRDLQAERRAAEALLGSLPLGGVAPEPGFRRRVADDQAALALLDALQSLGREDVTVEWLGGPPRLVRGATAKGLRVEVRDRQDWFGLEGELELDGERVKLALLLEALRERRTVVRLEGGTWLALAGELAERLAPLAHLSSPVAGGVEIGPSALGALDDLVGDGARLTAEGAFAQLRSRMQAASRATPRLPRAFKGELRDYQLDGFRWLARLASWGAGAVLADDMGLGKTAQALALLLQRAGDGPALVVAPTSVCANWVAEAARFAPSLRVTLFRDADRAGAVAALAAGDVLVVSYGLLTLDQERFRGVRFSTLVLDEAQAVKNAATRRARAVRELDAGFRVALSGTPIENHLGELWSLFRITFPGLLGSWELFRQRFALPIERDGDPARRRALAATVRPFLLRRTKAEVARELPTRTEITLPVTLSAGERRLYEQTRLATVARLAGLGDEPRPEQHRFEVLAAITRLRRLACHPRLHDPESGLPSAKLARFLDLVTGLIDGGHRSLVFSQFTSHLALVREALDAAGVRYLYLDGQTPPPQRDRLVARFQAGEGDLFLISLKAGGTGLNLTGADYVVHLDPWWNPAVEDQATDRAHRIGQLRPVTVYRLVAQGTIEEAIVRLHASKRELVAGVLGGMDTAARLSPAELMALVRAGPAEVEGVGAGDAEVAGVAAELEAEEAPEAGAAAVVEAAVAGAHAKHRGDPAAARGEPDGASGRLSLAFGRHLDAELERRRFRSSVTVKGYRRAAARFLEFLASEGAEPPATARALEPQVEGYLAALQAGRFPAPASEPLLARCALRELGRFLDLPGAAPRA